MGKITVKHYLNVNLKPYIVKGENYYSMYIMVIVNRKSTKVKSISFEELYTEKDFEDIQNEDNDLLNQEITVIDNICGLIQDVFREFDATMFSSYYSLLKDMFIGDVDFEAEYNLWDKKNNSIGLDMSSFVYGDFSLGINRTHGMDLFTWYSEIGQKNLFSFLEKEKIKCDLPKFINQLNKMVFLGSMDTFSKKLHESKKGRDLFDKYSDTIENDYWRYCEELRELYD